MVTMATMALLETSAACIKYHHFVERYWQMMLNSRNREGRVTWEVFHDIKACFPLQRPGLNLSYAQF
jgi:hypothetical protein